MEVVGIEEAGTDAARERLRDRRLAAAGDAGDDDAGRGGRIERGVRFIHPCML